jgi:hypothetical protein
LPGSASTFEPRRFYSTRHGAGARLPPISGERIIHGLDQDGKCMSQYPPSLDVSHGSHDLGNLAELHSTTRLSDSI